MRSRQRYLGSGSSQSVPLRPTRRGTFRQEFRALGYVEGKNIVIEYRSADDKLYRLPALADALVRLKVDVLLVRRRHAAVAAKNATTYYPYRFSWRLVILLRLGWLIAWPGPAATSQVLPRLHRR